MKNAMKKLMLGLVALFAVTYAALADQFEAQFAGYDAGCSVYFSPDYGYFRVCEGYQPVFLGWEFHRFHGGFRHSWGHGFGHGWNGFHGHGHGR